jgi:Bacterial Ig domain/Bacterial Ig-like domain (group 3)/Carboxypeptidase regulatory-like domain
MSARRGIFHQIRVTSVATALILGMTVSVAALAIGTLPASASVVTNCSESTLDAAIASGGTVTFTCSGIITLTNPLPVPNSGTLTIDGGNSVTISGDDLEQIAVITGGTVTFQNITLEAGLAQGITGTDGSDGTDGPAGSPGSAGVNGAANGDAGANGGGGGDGTAGTGGFSGLNGTAARGGALSIAAGANVTLRNVTIGGSAAVGGDGGTGGAGGDGGFGGGGGSGGSAGCTQGAGGSNSGTVGSATVTNHVVTAVTPSKGGSDLHHICGDESELGPAMAAAAGTGGKGGNGGAAGIGGTGGKGGAAAGGAVYNAGILTIVDSQFTNDEAVAGFGGTGGFGGVAGAGGEGGSGGNSTLSQSPLGGAAGTDGAAGNGGTGGTGGTATGGAIDNEGTLTLTGSTFSSNLAEAGAGSMGGTGGVAGSAMGGIPGGPGGIGGTTPGLPGTGSDPLAAATSGTGGLGGNATGGAVYNNGTLTLYSSNFTTAEPSNPNVAGNQAQGGIGGPGGGTSVGEDGFVGQTGDVSDQLEQADETAVPSSDGTSGGDGASGTIGGTGGAGGNGSGGALGISAVAQTSAFNVTFTNNAAGGGDGGDGGDGGNGGVGGAGGVGGDGDNSHPGSTAGDGGAGGNGGDGGDGGDGGNGGAALGGAIFGNLTVYGAGAFMVDSTDTVKGGDGGEGSDMPGMAGAQGSGGAAGADNNGLPGSPGAPGTAGDDGSPGDSGIPGSESNNAAFDGTSTPGEAPLSVTLDPLIGTTYGAPAAITASAAALAPLTNPPSGDKILIQASIAASVKASCTVTLLGGNADTGTCYLPSTLAVGSYSIVATFEGLGTAGGDSSYTSVSSASETQLVSPLSSTTSVSPPAPVGVGSAAQITAQVIGPGGVTPSAGEPVAIMAKQGVTTVASCTASLVGTSGSGSCSLVTSLAVGTYSILATYAGDANLSASSAVGSLAVVNATTTQASVGSPTANVGATVTYSATVAVTGAGTGTPTGTVSFVAAIPLGTSYTLCTTGPLSVSGQGSCTATNAPVGTDTVTARYGGQGTFGPSKGTTSLAVSVAPSSPPAGATASNSASSSSALTNAVASIPGVTATGSGIGALTVASYSTNPTVDSVGAGTGIFYDVEIAPGSSFSSVTIVQCTLGTGGNSLDWFNGSSWVPFSLESFNSGTGCVTATVTNVTSPSMAQLTGTPIAAVALAPPDYSLGINPSADNLGANSSAQFAVSVDTASNFSASVALSVSGLPTGVTGTFTSSNVTPNGHTTLTLLSTASYAPQTFTFVVSALGGGITHTIDGDVTAGIALPPNCPGSTVAGTVTDASTGDPIDGAHIVPSSGIGATTNASGAYSADDLFLGPQAGTTLATVSVIASGYLSATNVTVVVTCQQTTTYNVALVPVAQGAVMGHVYVGTPDPTVHTIQRSVTPTSTPIAGATIALSSPSNGGVTTTTGADGSYTANQVPLGAGNGSLSYTDTASAPGYWSASQTLTVGANTTESQDLALVPVCTGSITATVYSQSTGLPLPGAFVSFFDSQQNTESATSDQNGVVMFPAVPLGNDNSATSYPLVASAGGGSSPNVSASIGDCGDSASISLFIHVAIQEYGNETLTVTDATTGLPISGATVGIGYPDGASVLCAAGSGGVDHGVSASDGTFTFIDLNTGVDTQTSVECAVSVSAPGYLLPDPPVNVYVNADNTGTVAVALTPALAGTVVGTVTDAQSGQPLAGVQISEIGGGSVTTTNKLGQYTYTGTDLLGDNNSPQLDTVGATTAGYVSIGGSAEVSAGKTSTINLAMTKLCGPATISGTVDDSSLAPIAGANVEDLDGTGSATTDSQGHFTFQALVDDNVPFTTQIQASASGFGTESQTIRVFCGAHIVLNFGSNATATGSVTGTVTAASSGQPVSGAFVGSSWGATTTTAADGTYSFTGVPLGDDNAAEMWTVLVDPPAGSEPELEPATTSVTVPASPPSTIVNVTLGSTSPPQPVANPDTATDPENQTLAVAAPGLLGNDTGAQISVTSNTQPGSGGTVAVNADGSYVFTPDRGETGTDRFTYTITDDFGATATGTVTVTISSQSGGPVANPDSGSTPYATALVVAAPGVLANDTGTGLAVSAHTIPGHGTVAIGADGGYTYTPAAGFAGIDSFSYTVTDDSDLTSTTTVAITVAPPPTPSATDDSGATPYATALVVAAPGVLANDRGTGLVVSAHTTPGHGSVSIGTNGSYTYTPATGFAGLDSFTYTASDAVGQKATATVRVTVNPPAKPTADDDFATTAFETHLVVPAPGVLANDTGTGLFVSAHTSPSHGTVSIGANGSYTYTPAPGFSGADSFAYTVSDAVGQKATATVHLTVSPKVSPPPAASITGISPTSGPPQGGETVIIGGANLCGTTSAKFGSANASIGNISADCTTIKVTEPAGTGTVPVTVTTPQGTATSPVSFTYIQPGYWEAAADGGVFAFGGATFYGSVPQALAPGATLNSPIVAMADTPDHGGYWLFAADGGVFAFGDATFFGSVPGALGPGRKLNKPIVAAEATPDGGGYREFAADGGVFDFGDALFTGSLPGLGVVPTQPIDAAVSTPIGQGYWLVGGDGGIFTFGNARFEGSVAGRVSGRVVSMATTPDGLGYWVFLANGSVISEGDAGPGVGSNPGLTAPIVFGQSTSTGGGYWEFAEDGGVFAYGDAPFEGSLGGISLNKPITAAIGFGSTASVV